MQHDSPEPPAPSEGAAEAVPPHAEEPAPTPGALASAPVPSEDLPAASTPEVSESRFRSHRELGLDGPVVHEIMEPPHAVFSAGTTVSSAVEALRILTRHAFVTYLYVVDEAGVLIGVVAMRELLLAAPEDRLGDLMIRDVFSLQPEDPVLEAMRQTMGRHYPIYPVSDAGGRLVGLVRGARIFEAQTFELSAQAGQMVGVEKSERIDTPITRSLRLRHPWLQFNLITAFLAAAVVGSFQDTVNQVVLLAAFLPVLVGQSGNTGGQALAIVLRGITLGDYREDRAGRLVIKEAALGLLNGALVGITAGLGMVAYASFTDYSDPLLIGVVVLLAMVGSCAASGVAGTVVPLAMRRFGADPSVASNIFVTAATDVISLALFLGLATWLLL